MMDNSTMVITNVTMYLSCGVYFKSLEKAQQYRDFIETKTRLINDLDAVNADLDKLMSGAIK
jgi:hypothetical protein